LAFGKNLALALTDMFRPSLECGLVITAEFDLDLKNKGVIGS
jgi:hypothetical protein